MAISSWESFTISCLLLLSLCLTCPVLSLPAGTRRVQFDCDPCTEEEVSYCKPLPEGCVPARRPCGCCDMCKGRVGSYCSAVTPVCMDGLQCVSMEGEVKTEVPWYDFDFHGICMSVWG